MTDLEIEKERLLAEIKLDLSKSGYFTLATCCTNSFGWKMITHLAMKSLQRDAPKDMHISCKVNFEVTDWVVSL